MYCYILVLLCTTFVVKADQQADFEAKIASCSAFYTQHGHSTPNKDDAAALQGYKDFVRMVKEHNADPNSSYVSEVNCWSTINTPLPEMAVQDNDEEQSVGGNSGDSPDEYDRRADDTTTGARSQGSCGSCWAFSAIAALESKYLDLTGDAVDSVDFSEQQFLDCTYESNAGKDGCNGGWMTAAWSRLLRYEDSLLNSEVQRGYTRVDRVCDILTQNKPNAMNKVVMSGSGYTQVGDETAATIMGNNTQERIWLQGAIAIAIRVENALQSYKSGIFNTACTGEGVNHALTLIGYSQQAFIAQNSWGATWGDAGTLQLSRTSGNMCEMLTYTMWPTMVCAWGTDTTGKCVATEPCGGCQNNGKCVEKVVEGSMWACECKDGWEGDKCETSADKCASVQCGDNQECDSTTGDCECKAGWTGDKCDKQEDKCASVKCGDNQECNSTTGDCECKAGWTGDKCDKQEDKCASVKCGDNQECDSTTGDCECKAGWTGDKCDKQDKDCDKNCKRGKECFWRNTSQMACRCPGSTFGRNCGNDADCRTGSDHKSCAKIQKRNPDKFDKKCGKTWGKKKCPHSCGFCSVN